MATAGYTQGGVGRGSMVRTAATVVGALFLLVGILGFIPGITTDYDDLSWAGHHSGAMLFGIFQVSALHNIVHLIFGVAGLAMGRTSGGARTFLLGGGVVYLALWLYGLLIDRDSDANFVPVNTADNWLHLGLGAAMLILGLVLPAPGSGLLSGSPQPGRPEAGHAH
ncbi:DUF4383 domain-containing protein [Nocardia sp. CDC159]|uniref:DUF4383 domain-containing protein n=1 Tax=Nocardia pulmonis TaxID=2951408 RepID=A0A9X2IYE9_9NOCA|nr:MULTISPECIES: DUF4383 domain-containing protein [Nocardia]MCM6775584.1 DUF4383 domain-containing protein [Nocardia pulmonis]MCM6787682.1 DUF4383 domain-containing protein [Nocardia sp. CDC159]